MRLPRISKKFTGILVAVFLLAGLGIFGALSPVRADTAVPGFIASALASIAQVLIELIGKILIVLIQILLAVVQYNDFINAPAVVKTWVLVRDLGNMAFLVIFIAIAFATILGIEKYEYKQLLPKLLLMAVLINFSRTICGLIIDAAQVVMITFVNGFKEVASGNLIRGFGLTDMLTLRDLGAQEGVSDSALAAASILAVILLIIATVTVGIIVLMFLIRVIYLWILVALSPAAFLLSAAPGMSGKFSEWWDTFTRYVIVGPIMAFFLWMSFSIMSSVKPGENLAQSSNIQFGAQVNSASTVSGGVDARVSATITEVGRADNLLSYGMAIALLLLSLTVANSIGVKGGQLAGSFLSKVQSGGIKLGKLAGLTVATGGLGAAAAAYGAFKAAPYAPKGAWAGLKYWNQKRFATTGKSLDVKQAWATWKEKFADTKRKDIIKGSDKAAQLMTQGGAKGLFYGATGSRDSAEWYAQGFLGTGKEGGIARAWRTVTGGPAEAKKLAEQVAAEKKKEENAKAEAALLQAGLDKHDFTDEGREAYVDKHKGDIEQEIVAKFEKVNAETDNTKRAALLKELLQGQSIVEHGETLSFRSQWRKEVPTDRLPDNQLDLTPQQLREQGSEDLALEKEKFIKKWAERKAKHELNIKLNAALKRDGKEPQEAQIIKEVHDLGQSRIQGQVATKAEEIRRLKKNGLTEEEKEVRSKRLETLNERISHFTKEIDSNRTLGIDFSDVSAKLAKAIKDRNQIGEQDDNGAWHVNAEVDLIAAAEKALEEARVGGKADEIRAAENVLKELQTAQPKKLEGAEADLKRLKIMQAAPTWDDAKRTAVKQQIEGFNAEAAGYAGNAEKIEKERRKYQSPRNFYSARNRRALEDEEMRKITSELDSELIADVRNAIAEGDLIKGAALIKKLAKDANDNELWNDFGFGSNAQGMHDFFNAVVIGQKGIKKADGTEYTGPSFKMDEQTAWALENDVAFINEGVDHWNTARMMEVKDGRYRQLSNQEHVEAALAEILKKDPTDVIRKFNRLAYGGENPRADGSGRDFEMDALGIAILKSFAKEYKFRYGRSEFNKNAVMNIGKILDDLPQYGIDPEYITLTRDKSASFSQERAGGTNPKEIAKEVMRLLRQAGKV